MGPKSMERLNKVCYYSNQWGPSDMIKLPLFWYKLTTDWWVDVMTLFWQSDNFWQYGHEKDCIIGLKGLVLADLRKHEWIFI